MLRVWGQSLSGRYLGASCWNTAYGDSKGFANAPWSLFIKPCRRCHQRLPPLDCGAYTVLELDHLPVSLVRLKLCSCNHMQATFFYDYCQHRIHQLCSVAFYFDIQQRTNVIIQCFRTEMHNGTHKSSGMCASILTIPSAVVPQRIPSTQSVMTVNNLLPSCINW